MSRFAVRVAFYTVGELFAMAFGLAIWQWFVLWAFVVLGAELGRPVSEAVPSHD